MVQIDDPFLDGATGDQPVDGHRPLLADAVRATHRLVFSGRVPPRVGNHHVIGGGQVETEAAGFEADQEEVALAGLESGDAARALGCRGAAVEVLVSDSGLIKWFAQHFKKVLN